MDYAGSDNSGLGSVWIYSGPIWIMLDQIILALGSVWIYSGPIRITLDQIILVWDQYGFILGQQNPKPEFLVPPGDKP
jgi:hypothetical protein